MANDAVVTETLGPVSTIVLNRADKLNALDEAMQRGLAEALQAVSRNNLVRAAIITGSGRAFCAGGDIQTMSELKSKHHSATFRDLLEAGNNIIRAIRRVPKPVIASINGAAAGAGVSLALACDLRIASDSATFTQAFINVGLHPDWGGTYFLPRLVGTGRAIEMFFLGEPVDAIEAQRTGLVNFVVPPDKLPAETRRLAERLAAQPPLPLSLLKEALYERFKTQMDSMMEHEVEAQMKCFESEEFCSGLLAFLEKRRTKA